MTYNLKELVRQHWDNEPCGTGNNPYHEGSERYFDYISDRRYKLEPFIPKYAEFNKWRGKKVLEVGCGAGSDLIRFVKAGALVTGIDLSSKSVELTKKRLSLYGLEANILQADAEDMPFNNGEFDFCYSWGVLHHTENPQNAIIEIYAVLKEGGKFCIMLYNRHSLVALQTYLRYGIFRGKSLKECLANYHESKGTKAYTISEINGMFSMFKNLRIIPQPTIYDIRYSRNKYLPSGFTKLIPNKYGWFIIVKGER